jgi:hypothetical protein
MQEIDGFPFSAKTAEGTLLFAVIRLYLILKIFNVVVPFSESE